MQHESLRIARGPGAGFTRVLCLADVSLRFRAGLRRETKRNFEGPRSARLFSQTNNIFLFSRNRIVQ